MKSNTGRCGNCGGVHHTRNAALMCEAAHTAMAMITDALALPPRHSDVISARLADEALMYEIAQKGPTAERLRQVVRL